MIGKDDFRTSGSSDPIPLHGFHAVGPVQLVEIVEQPFGIVGDAQHPLPHQPPDNRVTSFNVFAVPDFLIGQHGVLRWTLVHGYLCLGEVALVELRKIHCVHRT